MARDQYCVSLHSNDQVICQYCIIAVPVRANKDIWILGDTFLTEAIAVLREMQNQNRDQLYLYSQYDPQIYYSNLLSKDTFASQIRCQLSTALEEHNKLPVAILIVLGNKNIDHKVMNPECTRRVWKALFTEIDRIVRTRKEDLPDKAKRESEPKVLINNMFPRFREHNDQTDATHETFKTKRRRFNGVLPQVANNFDYKVLPINGILPDNAELFATSTGQLNGKGFKEFWSCISKELKIQDVREQELYKSKIINEYFDHQREQRRLAQEKQRAASDRRSLPRVLHPTQLDRGDGNIRLNPNRKDRARSVPSGKNKGYSDHGRRYGK